MDKLTIRRALYTEPGSLQAESLPDAELRQLQQDLLAQDEQCRQRLLLDVPAGLADRVLLQQRLAKRQRWHWPLASAASALLLSSYLFWHSPTTPGDLGEHALRHVYHELAALQLTQAISAAELASLWSAEGLTSELGLPVRYARYCELDGIRSLHLVVEYQGQAVTLFILPAQEQQRLEAGRQFADSRFIGQQQQWQQRPVLVVAEQAALLEQFSQQLNLKHFANS